MNVEKLPFQSEQISAIQEAFSYFDTNKDGLISFREFRQILASFGENVSDDEIVDRMKAWDGDGDGTINFAEFLKAMAQILTDTDNDERMRDAFRIFDKDNNGFITANELARMMVALGHSMTTDEVQEMIKEADIDNDGKISFEEFKTVMKT